MVKFALIEKNIITQISCSQRSGFVEVDDTAVCGMRIDRKTGRLSIDHVEPSTQEKIEKLEANITTRRLREAVLGVDGGWLSDIESEISKLRSQL